MKLFFYYVTHSALNAIKKLFKAKVLLVFVLFLAGGLLVGGTIGLLLKKAVPDIPEQTQTEVPAASEPEDEVPLMEILELGAGAVVLAFFVFGVWGADKSGADIFQPADAALLFPSPMKPQSVLLFRTMTQIGASIAATLYITVYQIPNLMKNDGFSIWMIAAVFAGLVLTIGISQLFKMLCFVQGSVHPGFKRNLRRFIYLALALIAGAFYLFMEGNGLGIWEALLAFFNAPVTRYIPFWGWIKGFVMFAAEKNVTGALFSLAAVLAGGAGLAWLTWHVPADFYEEALSRTTLKAEMLENARSGDDGSLAKRKKDRSERIRRNEFSRGAGANVFFHKALYNRFRFAHLGFLTKTLEFYLITGLGAGLFCRFIVKTDSYLPVALILAACAFFRSLGSNLREDTRMWYFLLIPEDSWTKLMWSLAGDAANCFLDVLPGLVIGLLAQGAPLFPALLWIFPIVSVTAYATAVGTFLDLSINVSGGNTLKGLLQIAFIYFGLLPDAAAVGLFLLLGQPILALFAVTALNAAFAALFLLLAAAAMGK